MVDHSDNHHQRTVIVLVAVLALFTWATLLAPLVDAALARWRADRAETQRCGRYDTAPRFDGGQRRRVTDPSPSPRRRAS